MISERAGVIGSVEVRKLSRLEGIEKQLFENPDRCGQLVAELVASGLSFAARSISGSGLKYTISVRFLTVLFGLALDGVRTCHS